MTTYQITEAQRQQLLEFARQATYLTAPFDVSKAAHEMLQSLAPVNAEPVGWLTQSGRVTGRYSDYDAHLQNGAMYGWEPLYRHPDPLRELSDVEIEELGHRGAWKYKHSSDPHHSSTYTFNLHCLLDFARAVLRKAGEK